MDEAFKSAYTQLNQAQKKAVDSIEGPVLVIAGPGTGKTQLLTLRIANILSKTDTLPENLLCLTFTDSAAQTMRQRLTSFIGKAAYDITISTYHAFGNELLRRYPGYFNIYSDLQPADDLTIDAIFRQIQAALPYSNPLKFETFLRDVKQLVSDSKRALLTPEELEAAAAANQKFISFASRQAQSVFSQAMRIDKNALPLFRQLLELTEKFDLNSQPSKVVALGALWQQELQAAVAKAEESGKTTSLTKWKNSWLEKDEKGNWLAAGRYQNERVRAGAQIYRLYLAQLEKQRLYDYDDMILRAIHGLEENDDLRYTLQERYQYILLDEFQDTNEAQFRIVELLTDNPANEGRPDVMAVGDDDQAIYAFQGANYSHMLKFAERYRDTLVVSLTENYRSTPQILQTAAGIAGQIEKRLHHFFPDISKDIKTAHSVLPGPSVVARYNFKSPLTQNTWVAQKAAELISGGLKPHEIAVLAPKHEHLESLVPFFQHANLPIHYEKRENILDDPAIRELLSMARLVIALKQGDEAAADHFWPQALSYDFWNLPTSLIWSLSWQAQASQKSWTHTLHSRAETRPLTLFFLRLSQLAASESLERMLDYLIGVEPVKLGEADTADYRSLFYTYYFQPVLTGGTETQAFWQLLSNLTVLRERLIDYRAGRERLVTIEDFVTFTEAHQAANIKILNTNPYQEAADAVELMTAYKAKGKEYGAVFLLGAVDEVWGTKARALGSMLSLPPNLQFIRYAGTTEDERLRLLYVAITRAKSQLYLTSYDSTYSGRPATALKYLGEYSDAETQAVISPLLPESSQTVEQPETDKPAVEELSVYWQHRHYRAVSQPQLHDLLEERLQRFRLSATQLNDFIDVTRDGPTSFLLKHILRFPPAPSAAMEYGNAMHETLEWLHYATSDQTKLPNFAAVKKVFSHKLHARQLSQLEYDLLLSRGQAALQVYLAQRAHTISRDNIVEYSFRNENVQIGQAPLGGKIDKLIIDKAAKTITIVDYKTGRSYNRWTSIPKLHFYQNQLYFYKLLVEGSRSFKGYSVSDAYLEFIEPNEQGNLTELHLRFKPERETEIRKLIQGVWQHVRQLDFPAVDEYSSNLNGIVEFETDLMTEQDQ